MTRDEFREFANDWMDTCLDVLHRKGERYTGGMDRLAHFKQAGIALGVAPEVALLGMWIKHIISTINMTFDLQMEEKIDWDYWREVLVDMTNYSTLLAALVWERTHPEDRK